MFNTDHIQTTHVGSLPRPADVADGLFRPGTRRGLRSGGLPRLSRRRRGCHRRAAARIRHRPAVRWRARKNLLRHLYQGPAYRLRRRQPAAAAGRPCRLSLLSPKKLAESGGTPTYRRPRCVGPIAVKDLAPLDEDIGRFRRALDGAGYSGGFMNSASPGVIAQFQPSDFHADHESYVRDLGTAMRAEYAAIAAAGTHPPDRRARSRPRPACRVRRVGRRSVPRHRRDACRGDQRSARRRAARAGPAAHLLGQLRGSPYSRHRDGKGVAAAPQGERRGRSCSRPPILATATNGGPGGTPTCPTISCSSPG